MPDRLRTRFIVVGSGVAGLHTAWRASQHGDVLLLTKRSLFDSATAYAQGGIAAALGAGDSPTLHRQDTLAAGAALCDAAAVQVLVGEGPARGGRLPTAGGRVGPDPKGGARCRCWWRRGRRGCASSRRRGPSSTSIPRESCCWGGRRRTRRTASCTRTATRRGPRWRAP